jgi:hypothetical protein
MTNDEKRLTTRHLGEQNAQPMPKQSTWPLERTVPRAIEFRVGDTDTVITVPLQGFVVLGRRDQPGFGQADVDLTPHKAAYLGVSRRHAVIAIQDGRVVVKDMTSTNGTFLNGYALQPLHAYRLRDSDELRLGKLTMTVKFVEEPVAEPGG